MPPAALRTVAGIRIVDSKLAQEATELAKEASPLFLFNHSMRTFLFGSLVGKRQGLQFDEELLYLGCILHDIGLTEQFMGELPFEIQGAQAATHLLEKLGLSEARRAVVWDGIAMHASKIGQFKRPEVSLVGGGAACDVVGPDPTRITNRDIEEIINVFPRLAFKREFVRTCAIVVSRYPGAASQGFMRDIGERYVPGFHSRNICDAISRSPFND